MALSTIVTDIEGTTSSITFVHDVLFPYAREHLPRFVEENRLKPGVSAALASVEAEIRSERAGAGAGAGVNPEATPVTQADVIATLIKWIDSDKKHTALKALQGLIWERGYKDGVFQGHLYDDAATYLGRWRRRGLMLAVFSSGSVAAQRLLFGHSTHGDLTPLFAAYFDTTTGPKKEARSYQAIAQKLTAAPASALYLSDVEAELDAAREAGLGTIHVVRPGTVPSTKHRVAHTFAEVDAIIG